MTRRPGGPRRIAIIGSGFSGLCLAIHLKRAGIETFTIFEKADRIGGTWRDNTYPGAACDSPSFAYCFSFEQKTDWSRKWVEQSEILAYLDHCADAYGLRPHIRLGTEIAGAEFDEAEAVWRLRTTRGETIVADVLVSGTGQLNRPFVPEIPGMERFRGPCFHSARWDHDVPLDGRRIAVIGNAASAIQFVPRIAPRAARLHVFQRSANWMMPKRDRAFSEREKRRFARHPWLAKLYRWWIWALFESQFPVFLRNRFLAKRYEQMSLRAMHEQIHDPRLREALTPDYPIGGKRILISDDYYPTLERDDVELELDGIDHFTENGIVTVTGREIPVDVAILATGFQSTSFLAPMEIRGLGGRSLADEWKDGAHAYLGISVAGFPNFFMMYGPNTNLGHNSIVFMIECQTHYIMDCLRKLIDRDLAYVDLRRDAMDAYNRRLQRELERTAWAVTGKSWYKTESGLITNNWSGSTIRYWWRTRRADLSVYHQVMRSTPATRPGEAPGTGATPAALTTG